MGPRTIWSYVLGLLVGLIGFSLVGGFGMAYFQGERNIIDTVILSFVWIGLAATAEYLIYYLVFLTRDTVNFDETAVIIDGYGDVSRGIGHGQINYPADGRLVRFAKGSQDAYLNYQINTALHPGEQGERSFPIKLNLRFVWEFPNLGQRRSKYWTFQGLLELFPQGSRRNSREFVDYVHRGIEFSLARYRKMSWGELLRQDRIGEGIGLPYEMNEALQEAGVKWQIYISGLIPSEELKAHIEQAEMFEHETRIAIQRIKVYLMDELAKVEVFKAEQLAVTEDGIRLVGVRALGKAAEAALSRSFNMPLGEVTRLYTAFRDQGYDDPQMAQALIGSIAKRVMKQLTAGEVEPELAETESAGPVANHGYDLTQPRQDKPSQCP